MCTAHATQRNATKTNEKKTLARQNIGGSCYKQTLIIAWIFGLNFYNMDHCALLAHATQRNATKTNEKKTIWCGWSWPCKHRVYAVAYYIQS